MNRIFQIISIFVLQIKNNMEKPKNESIDNLKDDAVSGNEIKGGGTVLMSDVFRPTDPLTGELLNLPGNPGLVGNPGIADPLPLDGSSLPMNSNDNSAMIAPDSQGDI